MSEQDHRPDGRTEVRSRKPSSVLVVGTTRIGSTGLRATITESPELRLVAEAVDGPSVLSAARQHRPDHIIIAADGLSEDRRALLRELRKASPSSTLTLCADQFDSETLVETIELPIECLLAWADVTSEVLHESLMAATLGLRIMSPGVANTMLEGLLGTVTEIHRGRGSGVNDLNLTDREKQVLFHLREGWRQRQIAEKLHLRVRTLEGVVRNLKAKADATTTAELVEKTRGIDVSS